MASSKSKRRYHRRNRRKDKMHGYKRLPKKSGVVGHGSSAAVSVQSHLPDSLNCPSGKVAMK